jgi:hypothetical protein
VTARYSDPISHALSYAAKQLALGPGRASAALAYPANLAVLLARYDCDGPVIVAGVGYALLSQVAPAERAATAARFGEKFGPVVRAVALDALGPEAAPGRRSLARTWESAQAEVLEHFAEADPMTLDVRAAAEILACGGHVADVRRLGPEYLPQVAPASGAQLVWWFRAFAETLDRHEEWPRRGMLGELRLLTRELARLVGVLGS